MKNQTVKAMCAVGTLCISVGIFGACGGDADSSEAAPQTIQEVTQRPRANSQATPGSDYDRPLRDSTSASPAPGTELTVSAEDDDGIGGNLCRELCATAGNCVPECRAGCSAAPRGCADALADVAACTGRSSGACGERIGNCLQEHAGQFIGCAPAQ